MDIKLIMHYGPSFVGKANQYVYFKGEITLRSVRRTSWEQAKEKSSVMVQAGAEEGTHTRV